jgi:hypothetical protein
MIPDLSLKLPNFTASISWRRSTSASNSAALPAAAFERERERSFYFY